MSAASPQSSDSLESMADTQGALPITLQSDLSGLIVTKTEPVQTHRLPGIDGLRACAVLGVIFFHVGVPGCFLGWSGVWLFFVISGFLITGILLEAKQRPHYFKNFYSRRALRIFPIYFFCLFILFFIALALGRPIGGIAYYLLYVQNYHLASTHFEPAFPSAFNHTWSLAVEEQFYFLWPLIVRYSRVRILVWVCVAAICLAPLARVLLLYLTGNPYSAITPLITNVDALALGALLAIGLRTNSAGLQSLSSRVKLKRACELGCGISLIVLLGIVFSRNYHDYWTPTKWLRTIDLSVALTTSLSFVFASLLIYVVVWDSWLRKLLEMRVIAHIGKISYGIYMFHGLVLTYAAATIAQIDPRLSQSLPFLLFVNLFITYLLALASWTFLESPFLRLKGRFV